jgi:hypothetical protein
MLFAIVPTSAQKAALDTAANSPTGIISSGSYSSSVMSKMPDEVVKIRKTAVEQC